MLTLFFPSALRLCNYNVMKDTTLDKNETEFEIFLVLGEFALMVCYFIIILFWVDFADYRYDIAEFINKIN